jgi:protease IV
MFVSKVATSRDMSRDEVHEVARGRVWTGADARDRRLVDVLGGLDRAAEIAAERAGIPATADVDLVSYPALPPIERIRPPRSSESPGAEVGWTGWGSFAGLAAWLGLPAAGPLTLPWVPTMS